VPALEPVEIVITGDPEECTVSLGFPVNDMLFTMHAKDAVELGRRIAQTAALTIANGQKKELVN
jgi:hypothetical protein